MQPIHTQQQPASLSIGTNITKIVTPNQADPRQVASPFDTNMAELDEMNQIYQQILGSPSSFELPLSHPTGQGSPQKRSVDSSTIPNLLPLPALPNGAGFPPLPALPNGTSFPPLPNLLSNQPFPQGNLRMLPTTSQTIPVAHTSLTMGQTSQLYLPSNPTLPNINTLALSKSLLPLPAQQQPLAPAAPMADPFLPTHASAPTLPINVPAPTSSTTFLPAANLTILNTTKGNTISQVLIKPGTSFLIRQPSECDAIVTIQKLPVNLNQLLNPIFMIAQTQNEQFILLANKQKEITIPSDVGALISIQNISRKPSLQLPIHQG